MMAKTFGLKFAARATPETSQPAATRAPSAVSFKFAYYPSENTVHASAVANGSFRLEVPKCDWKLVLLK